MGWRDDQLKQEQRPRQYVVFRDSVEIGDAADIQDAEGVAYRAARVALAWHAQPRVIWATAGDHLYEIKRLKTPRPGINTSMPPGRRHG